MGVYRGTIAGIFITIFSCLFTSYCRNISLSGKVLDSENNPLGQAAVLLVSENITVTTGAQGTFAITGTPINQKISAADSPIPILVKNGILSLTPDQSNERTRLVYIWDGRSEQGRKVGRVSYVAMMPCTFYHRGKYNWDLPAKHVFVGVKKIDTN